MQCNPGIKAAFFYDYDGFVGNVLCVFYNISSLLPITLLPFELFTQFIFIPLNLLHILILLRKPIRPSAVATFLMFIAVSNAFSIAWSIKFNSDDVFKPAEVVLITPTYSDALREFMLKTMENFGRRSSTWFGVGMVFCQWRTAKGSEQGSALKTIGVLLFLNILMSVFEWLGQKISVGKTIIAILNGTNDTMCFLADSEFFTKNDNYWKNIYTKVDNIFSRYIPFLLFIFLFFSLRRKFKESNRIHQRDSIATPVTITESTTKLVYYLTLTYFFVEFPLAILAFCREFFVETFGMILIFSNTTLIFGRFFVLVIILKMFICLKVSKEYRAALKSLSCCG